MSILYNNRYAKVFKGKNRLNKTVWHNKVIQKNNKASNEDYNANFIIENNKIIGLTDRGLLETKLIIPENIEDITSGIFAKSNVEELEIPSSTSFKVLGSIPYLKKITLPIYNHTIIEIIEDRASEPYNEIEEINIIAGSILPNMFFNCCKLKKLTLCDNFITSVLPIGSFENCDELHDYSFLPETLQRIEKRALYNNLISSFTFSKNINFIDPEAFKPLIITDSRNGSGNLENSVVQNIYIDNINLLYDTSNSDLNIVYNTRTIVGDNTNFFVKDSITNEYIFLQDLIVPEGIKTINSLFFVGIHLNQINISSTVNNIGNNMFKKAELDKLIFNKDNILSYIPNNFCDEATINELQLSSKINDINEQAFNQAYIAKLDWIPIAKISCNSFNDSKVDFLNIYYPVRYLGVTTTPIFEFNKVQNIIINDQEITLDQLKEGDFVVYNKIEYIISSNHWHTFGELQEDPIEEVIPTEEQLINYSLLHFIYHRSFYPYLQNEYSLKVKDYKLLDIVIPEGIKTLPSKTFFNCLIRSIYFPASLQYIGEDCFFDHTIKFIDRTSVSGDPEEHWQGKNTNYYYNIPEIYIKDIKTWGSIYISPGGSPFLPEMVTDFIDIKKSQLKKIYNIPSGIPAWSWPNYAVYQESDKKVFVFNKELQQYQLLDTLVLDKEINAYNFLNIPVKNIQINDLLNFSGHIEDVKSGYYNFNTLDSLTGIGVPIGSLFVKKVNFTSGVLDGYFGELEEIKLNEGIIDITAELVGNNKQVAKLYIPFSIQDIKHKYDRSWQNIEVVLAKNNKHIWKDQGSLINNIDKSLIYQDVNNYQISVEVNKIFKNSFSYNLSEVYIPNTVQDVELNNKLTYFMGFSSKPETWNEEWNSYSNIYWGANYNTISDPIFDFIYFHKPDETGILKDYAILTAIKDVPIELTIPGVINNFPILKSWDLFNKDIEYFNNIVRIIFRDDYNFIEPIWIENCYNVTEVFYGQNGGKSLYYNCPNIRNVYIDNFLNYIKSDVGTDSSSTVYPIFTPGKNNTLYIQSKENKLVYNPLEEVIITDEIMQYNNRYLSAFWNCSSLKRFIIESPLFLDYIISFENYSNIDPNGILYKHDQNHNICMLSNPIAGCNNITELKVQTINNSNIINKEFLRNGKTIPYNLFSDSNCIYLQIDNTDQDERTLLFGCSESKINFSVDNINIGAFYNCQNLLELDLSKSFQIIIHPDAFYGCKKLHTIKFDKTINQLSTIAAYAFEGCDSLTHLTIPSGPIFISHLALFRSNIQVLDFYEEPAFNILGKVVDLLLGAYVWANFNSKLNINLYGFLDRQFAKTNVNFTNIYQENKDYLYSVIDNEAYIIKDKKTVFAYWLQEKERSVTFPSEINGYPVVFLNIKYITKKDDEIPINIPFKEHIIDHLIIPKTVRNVRFNDGQFDTISTENDSVLEKINCSGLYQLKHLLLGNSSVKDIQGITHNLFSFSYPEDISILNMSIFNNTNLTDIKISKNTIIINKLKNIGKKIIYPLDTDTFSEKWLYDFNQGHYIAWDKIYLNKNKNILFNIDNLLLGYSWYYDKENYSWLTQTIHIKENYNLTRNKQNNDNDNLRIFIQRGNEPFIPILELEKTLNTVNYPLTLKTGETEAIYQIKITNNTEEDFDLPYINNFLILNNNNPNHYVLNCVSEMAHNKDNYSSKEIYIKNFDFLQNNNKEVPLFYNQNDKLILHNTYYNNYYYQLSDCFVPDIIKEQNSNITFDRTYINNECVVFNKDLYQYNEEKKWNLYDKTKISEFWQFGSGSDIYFGKPTNLLKNDLIWLVPTEISSWFTYAYENCNPESAILIRNPEIQETESLEEFINRNPNTLSAENVLTFLLGESSPNVVLITRTPLEDNSTIKEIEIEYGREWKTITAKAGMLVVDEMEERTFIFNLGKWKEIKWVSQPDSSSGKFVFSVSENDKIYTVKYDDTAPMEIKFYNSLIYKNGQWVKTEESEKVLKPILTVQDNIYYEYYQPNTGYHKNLTTNSFIKIDNNGRSTNVEITDSQPKLNARLRVTNRKNDYNVYKKNNKFYLQNQEQDFPCFEINTPLPHPTELIINKEIEGGVVYNMKSSDNIYKELIYFNNKYVSPISLFSNIKIIRILKSSLNKNNISGIDLAADDFINVNIGQGTFINLRNSIKLNSNTVLDNCALFNIDPYYSNIDIQYISYLGKKSLAYPLYEYAYNLSINHYNLKYIGSEALFNWKFSWSIQEDARTLNKDIILDDYALQNTTIKIEPNSFYNIKNIGKGCFKNALLIDNNYNTRIYFQNVKYIGTTGLNMNLGGNLTTVVIGNFKNSKEPVHIKASAFFESNFKNLFYHYNVLPITERYNRLEFLSNFNTTKKSLRLLGINNLDFINIKIQFNHTVGKPDDIYIFNKIDNIRILAEDRMFDPILSTDIDSSFDNNIYFFSTNSTILKTFNTNKEIKVIHPQSFNKKNRLDSNFEYILIPKINWKYKTISYKLYYWDVGINEWILKNDDTKIYYKCYIYDEIERQTDIYYYRWATMGTLENKGPVELNVVDTVGITMINLLPCKKMIVSNSVTILDYIQENEYPCNNFAVNDDYYDFSNNSDLLITRDIEWFPWILEGYHPNICINKACLVGKEFNYAAYLFSEESIATKNPDILDFTLCPYLQLEPNCMEKWKNQITGNFGQHLKLFGWMLPLQCGTKDQYGDINWINMEYIGKDYFTDIIIPEPWEGPLAYLIKDLDWTTSDTYHGASVGDLLIVDNYNYNTTYTVVKQSAQDPFYIRRNILDFHVPYLTIETLSKDNSFAEPLILMDMKNLKYEALILNSNYIVGKESEKNSLILDNSKLGPVFKNCNIKIIQGLIPPLDRNEGIIDEKSIYDYMIIDSDSIESYFQHRPAQEWNKTYLRPYQISSPNDFVIPDHWDDYWYESQKAEGYEKILFNTTTFNKYSAIINNDLEYKAIYDSKLNSNRINELTINTTSSSMLPTILTANDTILKLDLWQKIDFTDNLNLGWYNNQDRAPENVTRLLLTNQTLNDWVTYKFSSITANPLYSLKNLYIRQDVNTWPTKITEINSTNLSTATSISNYAFANCIWMAKIDLKNTKVTSIGSEAFEGCTFTNEIYIPNTVTTINYGAFKNLKNAQIYCEASQKPAGWSADWAIGVPTENIHWGRINK